MDHLIMAMPFFAHMVDMHADKLKCRIMLCSSIDMASLTHLQQQQQQLLHLPFFHYCPS
jgi:hypothetical protein